MNVILKIVQLEAYIEILFSFYTCGKVKKDKSKHIWTYVEQRLQVQISSVSVQKDL